jgi:Domain of unknown function (DUF6285)
VATVAREMALGPAQEEAHRARLESLGVASETELALAIRGRRLDDRLDEVRAVLRATVRAKLAVAHPGYDVGDGSPP